MLTLGRFLLSPQMFSANLDERLAFNERRYILYFHFVISMQRHPKTV